ncbi:unnamed protein product [Protopolystoma xenopodis]|uniref:Uncharacterized protein n=1 Tax=Protopolystoma xenopodis TaxID=117903 RepID=A0A3S5B0L9_9PLAT|nr:unnamed protein product [Protopolystoma xenopodis]
MGLSRRSAQSNQQKVINAHLKFTYIQAYSSPCRSRRRLVGLVVQNRVRTEFALTLHCPPPASLLPEEDQTTGKGGRLIQYTFCLLSLEQLDLVDRPTILGGLYKNVLYSTVTQSLSLSSFLAIFSLPTIALLISMSCMLSVGEMFLSPKAILSAIYCAPHLNDLTNFVVTPTGVDCRLSIIIHKSFLAYLRCRYNKTGQFLSIIPFICASIRLSKHPFLLIILFFSFAYLSPGHIHTFVLSLLMLFMQVQSVF